jgi:MFS family permease
MIQESPQRAKKSVGTIVLLVLLSLANALTLVVTIMAWVDEVDHGADFDDRVLQAVALSAVLTAVAVVGLVGAWLTRKWGPRTYVSIAGLSLVLGLIISEGAISPLSLIGITLAVVLWLIAETNW